MLGIFKKLTLTRSNYHVYQGSRTPGHSPLPDLEHFGTGTQKWWASMCMHAHPHSCKHTHTHIPLVQAAGKQRCMGFIYMRGGWSTHLLHKWSCACVHALTRHACRSIPCLPPQAPASPKS